ncbi:hypothetical protein GRS66_010853 [Saccharomyces pastorianus]|uniref:Uncharacterized protein n=2 Tax=Saccharomyces TaxID=4930 RepID=A0A6C1EFK3_SACPS|nr:hypothetical protein GRS66_010853 [Saccharomyces pastorianus]CAI1734523.1 hypothetical protein SEUBUCD650_0O03310 [Saccharomyces eubayanus]
MARRGGRNLRTKAFKGGFHASAAIPKRDLTIQTNHRDGGFTEGLVASSGYDYNRNYDTCVDVGEGFPVSEVRAHVHDAVYSLLRMDLSFGDIKRLSHVNESFLETTFKELGLNIPKEPSLVTTRQKLPHNAPPNSLSEPCQSRGDQATAFEESIEIAELKRSVQEIRTELIQSETTQKLQESAVAETEEKFPELEKKTIPGTVEDESGKKLIKSDSSFYHDPEFRFFHTASLVAVEKKPTITSIVDRRNTTLQCVNEETDSTIDERRTKRKKDRVKTEAEGISDINDTNKRSLKQTSVVKNSAICDSSLFDRPVSFVTENDLLTIELEVRTLMLKTKTEIFKLSGLMNDKSVKKQLSDPRVRRSLLRTRDEIFDDVSRLFSDLLTEQND